MTATPAPEGAITEAELRAAIDRLGWYIATAAEPTTHPADRIIRDIERHREPEYEPGGIYQDAAGHRYLRKPYATDLPWLLIGRDGLVVERVESVPARPLRKLVPLPPVADLELLVASQPAWIGEKDLAAALHKLLEGGSDE